ncbi:hypothetical protein N7491_005616 [Penicillium cf. griseofulvum]|uniref:Uncharacterized protein n=1 Tax=Penicillium cf. griseofulvum TaxID=2972120 RepID=A0A9W9J3H1_9EURO|nr:hypothetical protein N7472_008302 [Penicillium cf. griseofulvum]KAJ5435021.1 hypothetical protein N7491_005616 [Penicillium cf. griseofulvum]KAJ5452855.1 hypothetical protein N7445_001038 [Penicillium cf. griseofulvum]
MSQVNLEVGDMGQMGAIRNTVVVPGFRSSDLHAEREFLRHEKAYLSSTNATNPLCNEAVFRLLGTD